MTISNLHAIALVALASVGVVACAEVGTAHASVLLAQAGSTGGSIGKQGKSVSGTEERSQPPAAQPRTPPRPRPQPSSKPAATSATAEVSLTGRWNVVETCVSGNFPLVYDIQQGSRGSFSGTARTAGGTGHTERILDGRVEGTSITFSRTITGDLLGARTPRFTGSVVTTNNQAREFAGSFQQVGFTCTFRGTR
jgi:hypothetical protein